MDRPTCSVVPPEASALLWTMVEAASTSSITNMVLLYGRRMAELPGSFSTCDARNHPPHSFLDQQLPT